MAEAARAFDNHGRPSFLESVPSTKPEPAAADSAPWTVIHPTALPPMMLDFHLTSGRILSHPYSSLDFVDLRDAGHLQIGFLGLHPILVTIEGRHLNELRAQIVNGRVRAVRESDERDEDRDESEAAIVKINIERLSRS